MRNVLHLVLDLEAVRDPEVPFEPKAHAHISPYAEPYMRAWSIHESNPFPPPPCWQIACIGTMLLINHLPVWAKCVGTEADDEKALLRKIAPYIDRAQPVLVSWSGRRYDVPVLFWRALHHRIACPYLAELLVTKRFSIAQHFDLADWTAGFGAAPPSKLVQAAAVARAGEKTDGVDGSKVAEMLTEWNGLRKVRAYCLQDVALTARVFLEVEHMRGVIGLEALETALRKIDDILIGRGGLETEEPPPEKESGEV